MNESVTKTAPHIEVHQCLFGYQDGHRLLTSSLRLQEEAASILLLLSDLAPGLSLPPDGSYWTGIPLPSAKSYALMRTWLAPEMSRPGCVWTHALIVAFSDIARFPDLSVLVEHVTRPSLLSGFEMYGVPILLTPPSGDSMLKRGAVAFDSADAHRVVQAIYADNGTGKVVAPLGALDDTIFAIWSQQWPRLRRSFSFRTWASSSASLSTAKRFDLVVLLGADWDKISLIDGNTDDIDAWEEACVDDLLIPHDTEFRRFLWRYGSDVRLGLKRFKFLVNLYLSTRSTRLFGKNLHKILTNIIKVLPSPKDGKVLKEDLVGQNHYSLLPSTDPIDMLAFYVSNPIARKLPTPPDEAFEANHYGWSDRLEEILSIAEIAAKRETELGNKLLDRLAVVTDASTFLSSTTTRPNLRNKLLMSNPLLLDSDDLINISGSELLRLIDYVPVNDHLLIGRILSRLLAVDNTDLANAMVQRFPDSAIATIIAAMESFLTGGGAAVPQSWMKALRTQSSKVLNGGFIERSRTTSILSFFASMLGYAEPSTLQVGPMPWAKGLKNAHDDLKGSDRQKFLVFLLELALHKPESGCEPLFEIAFDPVHADLRYSNLSSEQTSQLLQYLPNLGWLKSWDNCLRLRVGIVEAYVTYNLSPKSFERLTANADLYEDLIELADNSKAGRQFLKKLI